MNQTNFKSLLRHMVYAAVCLALCMVLPFLTGQIPQIGSALSPMHIPVLLAGFLCGPWWAMAVGFAAPLLRHVWMGMPPLITAIAMSFVLENLAQAIPAIGPDPKVPYTLFAKTFTIGGVSVSQLEMAQNAGMVHWTFEEVDGRLKGIMKNIYTRASETAKEYGEPDNLLMGANVSAFREVADAMIAQGDY